MASHELKVTERDNTLTPRQLRAAGFVPATLYGKGEEARSVQIRAHEFQQFFTQGVREFSLTGFVTCTVRAKEVQLDPVTQRPISIQFQNLDAKGGSDKKAGKQARKTGKADKKAEATPVAKTEPEAEPAPVG